MKQDHVHDLLPGYALGILEPEDLRNVSQHLQGCAECRQAAQMHLDSVALMADAVPQYAPPLDLKVRILGQIEMKTQPSPITPRLSFWERWLRALSTWFATPTGVLVGGLALLLVVALSINNLLLWSQIRDLQGQVVQQELRLVQLSGTTNAPKASGYIVFNSNQTSGTLILVGTPNLNSTQQYQLWLIKDGKRTSGGVFSVNEAGSITSSIRSDKPLDSFQSFGITIEPTGGSPAPTGAKVLGGDL